MVTGKIFSLETFPSAKLVKTMKRPVFSLVFKFC